MAKQMCACGKVATWMYMPRSKVYCENCVPRGCICQIDENFLDEMEVDFSSLEESDNFIKSLRDGTSKFLDKHARDEKKRLLPCVEYMYDEAGFDEGTWAKDVLNKLFDLSDDSKM